MVLTKAADSVIIKLYGIRQLLAVSISKLEYNNDSERDKAIPCCTEYCG